MPEQARHERPQYSFQKKSGHRLLDQVAVILDCSVVIRPILINKRNQIAGIEQYRYRHALPPRISSTQSVALETSAHAFVPRLTISLNSASSKTG